jgi:hypothetical protein
MDRNDVNDRNGASVRIAADSPWHELREAERQISRLIAERPEATVREIAPELERLARAIADAREELGTPMDRARHERHQTRHERVADALLPADVGPPSSVLRRRRSADARLALVREWGAWSAGELADRAGSAAANRSALAAAWRSVGRVIGVEWRGRTIYPGFQFAADGQPRSVIGRVVSHLRRAGLSDWQIALWFTSPTGWLDDRRPVDLLEEEAAAVEGAAAGFGERRVERRRSR